MRTGALRGPPPRYLPRRLWCPFLLACTLGQPGGALAQQADAPQAQPEQQLEPELWRTGASLETWSMATHRALRRDSPLNPGNGVAGIDTDEALLDARLQLRAERGAFDAVFVPRLVQRAARADNAAGDAVRERDGQWLLTQGLVRYKSADAVVPTVVLGREVLSWGPASFRSPSNPFYFDSDRGNPLAATAGIDLARATWIDGAMRYTAAWVFSTSALPQAASQGQTGLFKIDRQGSDYLASLILGRQRGGTAFAGAFVQTTLNDAWLVYGEFGSTRQPASLLPGVSDTPPLYAVRRPAPRHGAALAGASYTLENGQVAVIEYLHDGAGYGSDQERRYFEQADAAARLTPEHSVAAYGALGQALSLAPRLLGRDYLSLSWQSNGQDTRQFWRLGWTRNLNDRSAQALLYYERNLIPRLSVFVSLSLNTGDVRREFGALMDGTASVGVKWFMF